MDFFLPQNAFFRDLGSRGGDWRLIGAEKISLENHTHAPNTDSVCNEESMSHETKDRKTQMYIFYWNEKGFDSLWDLKTKEVRDSRRRENRGVRFRKII